jgi:hypothetical protein
MAFVTTGSSQRRLRGELPLRWLLCCCLFACPWDGKPAAAAPAPTAFTLQFRQPTVRIPNRYQSVLKSGCWWQGDAQLQGRRWLLGAFEFPATTTQEPHPGIAFFLLQPAELSGRAGEEAAWIFCPTQGLFVDGHAYRLEWAVAGVGKAARLTVAFTDEICPLGEMKVQGNDIRRLQLQGRRAVLLENPGPVVRLPVDKYSLTEVTLGIPGNPARFMARLGQQVQISTTNVYALSAGGPLTNRIRASMQGRSLRLDYQLVGANGHSYQNVDLGKVPGFRVYRASRRVGGGDFQYG